MPAGVKAIAEARRAEARALEVGENARSELRSRLREQLHDFQSALQRLAAKHRKQIASDPEFRANFARMCSSLGVDPLASSRSGVARALGWWGDLDHELGVQAIEACIALRERSGGLVPLSDALHFVQQRRGPHATRVSKDDVARAVGRLKPLGGGWGIVTSANGERFVRSLPVELDSDHGSVLSAARDSGGFISCSALSDVTGWHQQRAQAALDALIEKGIAMIDDPPDFQDERLYWFSCLHLSQNYGS
jgi:ESCRT-II complex subunit VPS22